MDQPTIKHFKKDGYSELNAERRIKQKSELSELHKKYKTLKSSNLNKHFKKNPDDWYEYHKIAEDNEKSYDDQSEIPYQRVISYLEGLKGKSSKIVADLGCGTARVSKYFSNKLNSRFIFRNFDHIAIDDSVIERDISNTELDENSVNIVVLSLALWGYNKLDYIKEAYRILEDEGSMIFIEPSSRWMKEENDILVNDLEKKVIENGFRVIDCEVKKFMYIRAIKN